MNRNLKGMVCRSYGVNLGLREREEAGRTRYQCEQNSGYRVLAGVATGF